MQVLRNVKGERRFKVKCELEGYEVNKIYWRFETKIQAIEKTEAGMRKQACLKQ